MTNQEIVTLLQNMSQIIAMLDESGFDSHAVNISIVTLQNKRRELALMAVNFNLLDYWSAKEYI
jgi:hypothetical protein